MKSKIKKRSQAGLTLLELIIVITVLSVLALGTIPIVQNAVRRQKEQKLRETLREIRSAIDEFHRDASGVCTQANQGQTAGMTDPRSRVMISDCKVFETENIDRYPPTLEILVQGVEVQPRNPGAGRGMGRGGSVFDDPNGATGRSQATEAKKKVYLREIPIDPITGEPFGEENFRSCYQEVDAQSWDQINVFDVRSRAEGETLDGIKYSDL